MIWSSNLLTAVCVCVCPTALAPLISCSLQSNPALPSQLHKTICQASRQGFPLHTLASAAIQNDRGRFHNPLTHASFMTLKPENLVYYTGKFDCHLGVEPGTLESHLHRFPLLLPFVLFLQVGSLVLRSPLLLSQCWSSLTLISLSLSVQAWAPILNFPMLSSFPLQTVYFVHLFAVLSLFHYRFA